MHITFKFNTFGIVSFLVLCGLFYWMCPVPDNAFWRYLIYGVFALGAFFASFVIVRSK